MAFLQCSLSLPPTRFLVFFLSLSLYLSLSLPLFLDDFYNFMKSMKMLALLLDLLSRNKFERNKLHITQKLKLKPQLKKKLKSYVIVPWKF